MDVNTVICTVIQRSFLSVVLMAKLQCFIVTESLFKSLDGHWMAGMIIARYLE